MNNMFRVRCLVGLYWNAPEAMDAKIQHHPSNRTYVTVARQTDVTFRGGFSPARVDTKTETLKVETLLFRRPPDHDTYRPYSVVVHAAYDREENIIHLVDAKTA